jgi:hypothetical protein
MSRLLLPLLPLGILLLLALLHVTVCQSTAGPAAGVAEEALQEIPAVSTSSSAAVLEVAVVDKNRRQIWGNWTPIVPENFLVELHILSPSGIMLSEHMVRDQVVRIGRLRHSVIAIRTEWAKAYTIKGKGGSRGGLIPSSICKSIIEKTEEYAMSNEWTINRHPQYPTTDIPLRAVFPEGEQDPITQAIDTALLKIYAEFAKRFHIKEELLQVDDLFIAKYDASQPERQV